MQVSNLPAPTAHPGSPGYRGFSSGAGTVPAAASHNHTRHLVRLAVRHKTDYLLRMRCRDRSARRRLHNSEVWAALNEFYSDTEIRAIIVDCDAAIGAIAGGCAAI